METPALVARDFGERLANDAPVSSTIDSYRTRGGIVVHRRVEDIPMKDAIEPLLDALDSHRGLVFASSYEYPGRYTRWDMGFVDPPLAFTSREREFSIRALNPRGRILLLAIATALRPSNALQRLDVREEAIDGTVT